MSVGLQPWEHSTLQPGAQDHYPQTARVREVAISWSCGSAGIGAVTKRVEVGRGSSKEVGLSKRAGGENAASQAGNKLSVYITGRSGLY